MALATWLCFALLLLFRAVSGCTSGFMQLDLLKKRAEKITNGNTVSGNKLDNELRVVPGLSFTCSGTITSLLLGVDMRTVDGNRVEYPEMQIWREGRRIVVGDVYNRQSRTDIALTAGNSSPDGVLQYNLTTPIPFQSGDIFGVYQPPESDSVVRLFYVDDSSAPVAAFRDNNARFNFISQSGSTISNQYVLILPITDPSTGCTSNSFLTPEQLRQRTLDVNINRVITRDQQQRVFPDITFTCSGSISKWIVGAGTGGGSSPPSELQIWRRAGQDYTKVGSTQLTAQSPTSDPNVYEYILSSPLGFQEGDILGVYQRDGSSIVPYYQESTGPENLRQNGLVSSAPNSLTAPPLAAEYDYPLVTVEIGPPLTSATAVATISTSATSISVTPSSTLVSFSSTKATIYETSSIAHPSFTAEELLMTTSVTPAVVISVTEGAMKSDVSAETTFPSIQLSKTPKPTLSASGNNVPIIAAVVGVLLVVLGTAIVAVVVALVVIRRKKAKQTTNSYTVDEKIEMGNLNNPTYTAATDASPNHMYNPLYADTNAGQYETPVNTYEAVPMNTAGQYETPLKASMYEQPGATLTFDASAYEQPVSTNSYESGVVIPTMAQRKEFTNSENHYEISEEIYSQVAQGNSELYQTWNSSFFEETNIYWEPGSESGAIYEQLAEKRFREIIRSQIEITEHLGSGQFGLVERGVWHLPTESIEVAVKTLKSNASEQELVKFLQEAAIMGQFHHPNVVKLHGMVTVGEPAMIVLELVKNGDLKEYLTELRPTPGELAPPSLPQQLLGYCRQIASGMEYLSKKSFVHRDLAARNILVDDKRTCKIADFGMSRDLSDSDYYVSQGGKIPIKWTAPEAVHFKKYSTASDVWSFGVLMYEIWSLGHKPFEGKMNREIVELIDSGYRLPPPPGCPRAVYQLMTKCWHSDTSKRPTFASLVSRLSQPEKQLLKWTDRDKTHPQSTMLGAPLETASNLHSDLQQQYL